MLVRDGILVAAVEAERFRRVEHWAGFPAEAIRACLELGGVTADDVDAFAVSRNPRANRWRMAAFALRRRPAVSLLRDKLRNARRVTDVSERLAGILGLESARVRR